VAVRRSYEEELRAVGQTLEAKGINVFEIASLQERYLIQGMGNRAGSLGKKLAGFLGINQQLERSFVYAELGRN
jgi:hypothetical protein